MEISICAGKFGDKDFPEITKIKMEPEDLLKYLAGKELLDLLREKKKDNTLAILRTVFDPNQAILFVWIDSESEFERRQTIEKQFRWFGPGESKPDD